MSISDIGCECGEEAVDFAISLQPHANIADRQP